MGTPKRKDYALSKMEMHRESPFAQQALVRIGDALVSRKTMGANKDEAAVLKAIDTQSGEILGNTVFMRNKAIDNEQFAKIYFAQFQAFWELRPSAIKVFGYILKLLKPNSDEFIFFVEDCMESLKLAQSTIYRALGELCSAGIIARGRTEELYYINPMVVFNGDRVTFATTYINKNYPQHQTKNGNLKGTIEAMKEDGSIKEIPMFPELDENNNG